MIRRNADGSITVGILPEEKEGVANPAPSSEGKPVVKTPRKRKSTKE
jgi:hypothetical protein